MVALAPCPNRSTWEKKAPSDKLQMQIRIFDDRKNRALDRYLPIARGETSHTLRVAIGRHTSRSMKVDGRMRAKVPFFLLPFFLVHQMRM